MWSRVKNRLSIQSKLYTTLLIAQIWFEHYDGSIIGLSCQENRVHLYYLQQLYGLTWMKG